MEEKRGLTSRNLIFCKILYGGKEWLNVIPEPFNKTFATMKYEARLSHFFLKNFRKHFKNENVRGQVTSREEFTREEIKNNRRIYRN